MIVDGWDSYGFGRDGRVRTSRRCWPEKGLTMSRLRKVLWVGGAIIVVMLAFGTWYRVHYSMAPARAFEIAGAPSAPRVLIATQGSSFKDSIVAGVVDHLKKRQAHVRVIDIAGLAHESAHDWNAVVVIHTWEMRKPPVAAKAFVDSLTDRRALVVLTTSGAGDFKMAGVDTISAASRMEDVPARVAEVTTKLDAILANAGGSTGP